LISKIIPKMHAVKIPELNETNIKELNNIDKDIKFQKHEKYNWLTVYTPYQTILGLKKDEMLIIKYRPDEPFIELNVMHVNKFNKNFEIIKE
jgi:hypothetical protein